MYCKALVEIYAPKVKPCFVSISGAEEPLSLMGWEAGGAELGCRICPLRRTLLFASALDLPKLPTAVSGLDITVNAACSG